MSSVEHTTRRGLLKGAAGALSLAAASRVALPGGAFAQGAGPEVKGAKLGFIALTDAAPSSSPRRRASSPSMGCRTSRS